RRGRSPPRPHEPSGIEAPALAVPAGAPAADRPARRGVRGRSMLTYDLQLPFPLRGDQPQAVEELIRGFEAGQRTQTLLGVTGSGKTVTMASVIAALGRPALVMSHNKTLAAQLYGELKQFFPRNA